MRITNTEHCLSTFIQDYLVRASDENDPGAIWRLRREHAETSCSESDRAVAFRASALELSKFRGARLCLARGFCSGAWCGAPAWDASSYRETSCCSVACNAACDMQHAPHKHTHTHTHTHIDACGNKDTLHIKVCNDNVHALIGCKHA